jgi:hypothetical protein
MENSKQFEYTYDGVKIKKKPGRGCLRCLYLFKSPTYCHRVCKSLSVSCKQEEIIFVKAEK